MATNLVLMKESKELLELSKSLGFNSTLFLDDIVYLEGENKKELLKRVKEAKAKNLVVVVRVDTEEMLRFVLEKTNADLVVGQELINKKDSVHFLRGGLDQIVCKIAASSGKIIGFSFREVLLAKDKAKLLGRMMFNLKLCRKYKVKVFLGSFALGKEEIRAAHDLRAFLELLGGEGKAGLEFSR